MGTIGGIQSMSAGITGMTSRTVGTLILPFFNRTSPARPLFLSPTALH